jgi:hypothetical protein
VLRNTTVNNAKESGLNPVISLPPLPPPDLSFRHIIGGPTRMTSHLSQLLDIILRPLINFVPSYLKDSFDVIRLIDSRWRPMVESGGNFTLYSWDIKDFYPSISFDLIRRAITFWLERHSNAIDSRFSHQFIIEAIEIITSKNNCVFNDSYYRFIKGLATGTNAAVTIAILVRGF